MSNQAGAGQGLLAALADHACVVVTDAFLVSFYRSRLRQRASDCPRFADRWNKWFARRLRAAPESIPPRTRSAASCNAPSGTFGSALDEPSPGPRRTTATGRVPTSIRGAGRGLGRRLAGAASELTASNRPQGRQPGNRRRGRRPARKRCNDFCPGGWPVIPNGATSPRRTPRVGCRRICTSAMFRPTRCFIAWPSRKTGRRNAARPRRKAGGLVGNERGGRGISRSAHHLARAGLQLLHVREDYDRYESLPDWAKKTLAKHGRDRRPTGVFGQGIRHSADARPAVERRPAATVVEGQMHNYLRMLWGKKILEWSATPEEALATMIELNNKYAVDGRDPNSYSGIFWILGRFDRAWGPERPIFGTIRYMSSDNTARKFDVKPYLAKYGPTRAARMHPTAKPSSEPLAARSRLSKRK